ncbi:M28 family metallopeptidase [Pseudonocardia xinjiangensis]|uniref:M28 family metallopeptidase n=1 Tax=Pseudonocardia xinjiangensis TaxID=75289 RepID=UPI003D8E496E
MTAATRPRRSRVVAASTAGLVALVGSVLTAGPASAAPAGCDNRTNDSVEKLLECVTVEGVRAHLQAFQDIADAHDGTRASGTDGYDASVQYVADQAREAGLTVTTQDFEFPFFQLNSAAFAQTAPAEATYAVGTDFAPMTFSGSGDVTGTVVPVDLLLPSVGGSTSGCEAADFAGFPAGGIALLQRGTCDFGVKATNAAAAGAAGAVIMNEGNAPDRTELLEGTLGAPLAIPVVGTTFALGESLQNATVSLQVDAISENRTTTNVFAETAKGGGDTVLMVGAHLDSVPEGPGINDNGSGSASILEVATLMGKAKPTATVRFAWWGAEELGLLGSEHYVASLPEPERARIAGYLNFDMVGSPNFVRFVYDGDNSDAVGAGPGPAGSAAIEDVFEKFFADRGLASEGTDFDGRSDYGPFIAAGIPAGGLFTGAEGVKTPEQAATYGGTAGAAYDPCYHQACDTIANINDTALEEHADAIAYSTFTLASDPALITGAAPAAPSGPTGATAGGGGLAHDHGGLRS